MWYMKAWWIVKKSNIDDNVRTPSAHHTTKCQTGTTQHWIAINKHKMLLLSLRVRYPNHFQSNSFHNAHKISRYAQMTSRNAYTTSRFSVPASAGPLLPLWNTIYTSKVHNISKVGKVLSTVEAPSGECSSFSATEHCVAPSSECQVLTHCSGIWQWCQSLQEKVILAHPRKHSKMFGMKAMGLSLPPNSTYM